MKNNKLNVNKKSFLYVILIIASTIAYFVRNKEDRNKYVKMIEKYSLLIIPIYSIKKIFDLNFIPEDKSEKVTIDNYSDEDSDMDFDCSDLE